MKTLGLVVGYALLTVLLFLLGTIVGQLGAMLVSQLAFPGGRHLAQSAPLTAAWFEVLILVGPALAITGLLALWVRLREKGALRAYVAGRPGDALVGGGLGVAFWLTTVALAVLAGGVRPGHVAVGAAAAIPFLTLLGWAPQAFSEELVFRGWLLTRLRLRLGAVVAVIVSALIFAVTHGLDPETTPVAYVNLALGGVWFALLALRTGGIVAPALAHLAWNWMETSGFGLLAKGDDPQGGSVLQFSFAHPTLLSGSGTGLNDGLALGLAFALFISVELALLRRPGVLGSTRKEATSFGTGR